MYKILLKWLFSWQLLFLKSKHLNYLSVLHVFSAMISVISNNDSLTTCKVFLKKLDIYILKYNLRGFFKIHKFKFFSRRKTTHLRNSVLLFSLNKYLL